MCPGACPRGSRTESSKWVDRNEQATPDDPISCDGDQVQFRGVLLISTWLARALSRYALLFVLALLMVTFTILLPHTFPTAFNFRLLSSEKSVVALLALAVLVPLSANHYDLSVGSVLGLVAIITIGFQVKSGLPWKLAVALAIAAAAFIGAVNGLLVTRFRVGSFIATLGVGTVVYGVGLWYTGGEQVNGDLPSGFLQIASTPFGMPLPAIIAVIVATLMWLLYSFTPIGRYLYVIGDNPRAAELVGIPVKRYTFLAFIASGVLAGLSGVILAAELRVGQSAVGPEYLLPAFAAVLFGATSIDPGRVNVWGTLCAVLVLAVAVSGLEQEGAQAYVEPMFNGGMLVIAVAIAAHVTARRKVAKPTLGTPTRHQ
jgi:ribose transport system permease protein